MSWLDILQQDIPLAIMILSGEFIIVSYLFKRQTGQWPWYRDTNKRGVIARFDNYDEQDGKFKGAVEFSANALFGFGNEKIITHERDELRKKVEVLQKRLAKREGEQIRREMIKKR